VAPLDPFTWVREELRKLVEVAAGAPSRIIIILPSPKPGAARHLLADRLGMDENELERRLKVLSEDVFTAWDRVATAEGSTLVLLEHEELLTCGLLLCDGATVIETGPAIRQSPTDRLTLAQRFAVDSPYGRWAAEQLQDMVASATPVGVRPVTAPAQLPGRRAGQPDAGPEVETPAISAPSSAKSDPDPNTEAGGNA
jgi:hypothetical protein